jgi:acetyl-CoA carboxylase carboxyltransferase component
VIALPTTRAAVMGPAGVEFIYKDELRDIRSATQVLLKSHLEEQLRNGLSETDARAAAEKSARQWAKEQEALLAQRYEQELMNPNEALSLGSISQIVMPSDLREVLTENLRFHLNHYQPEPLNAVQREFF